MALGGFDIEQMERALFLAEKARGLTGPNPVVGAVVTRDGQVLGEGYHAGAGSDHAEIVAMKAAVGPEYAARLIGGTVYVTLEPCCHFGRTPPCTKALLEAGVGRVVAGALDPSSRMNGAGIQQLRDAGVEVEVAGGDLGRRARRQNGPFRKHAVTGLPFITYKYAMTLDGRTATQTGSSRWISGPESRRRVHQLRAWTDAVMVGGGTLSADDPQLTVRDVSASHVPLRVVIDPSLSIVSASCALARTVSEGPVLAVCSEGTQERRQEEVRAWGLEVAVVAAGPDGFPAPCDVARLLGARGIQSVLMEGGPRLAAAWWDADLVDQVVAFVAPIMSGGVTAPGPLPARGCEPMAAALRLLEVEVERSGEDIMISGYTREAY